MPPPVWFFSAIAAMVGLAVFTPGIATVPDAWSLGGLLPIAAGVGLNVAAVGVFRRRATTTDPDVEPTSLVTEGPYRFTRNPMYLGGVLILFGLALLLGAAAPFVVPPIYALIAATRFVPPEERTLARTFGDDYARYRDRVRRWL